MKLRVKFNLALLFVFAIATVAALWVARAQFFADAREDVTRQAELLMETALAVRGYTTARIQPQLNPMLEKTFLPETVPAFAATETINLLRKKYTDYGYKEATLNPTNPRDLAVKWEVDVINRFRSEATLAEQYGERQDEGGHYWYVARPIKITNPQCLSCHSTPDAAPASMIRTYGSSGGFGWRLNEIIGAQIVTVPMAVPLKQANETFRTFIVTMIAVFLLTAIVLNFMLTRLIIRPVTQVARAAEAVSMGRDNVPEFPEGGKDEVADLRRSFNRMRRSLVVAMQMIQRKL